jgi:hypothetical protein
MPQKRQKKKHNAADVSNKLAGRSMRGLCDVYAAATKANSVCRSLKLKYIDLGYSTRMGDRQVRPIAVNLRPYVGVD